MAAGHHGVYNPPRQILKEIPGLELLEMVRNEENSFCCGGGGGVPEAFPDFAMWTAKQRLREANSTGAEAIISCCPFCQSNFEKAIDAGKERIRYFDLTELLVNAL
jgi:Fe-S oxidoreductase